MNYIAHLNKVLNLFVHDFDLTPSHISLYMALFREWNYSRFSQKFSIQRKELMNAAKIGSNTTFHRCINDLHKSRYIHYKPSKNPHKGSVIQMSRYKTVSSKQTNQSDPDDVSDLELYSSTSVLEAELYSSASVPVTIYKHINDKERRPLNEFEVIKFFKEKGQIPAQALKFFRYYESNQWMTSNKEFIKDWKSVAEKWILNDKRNDNRNPRHFTDHLQTTRIKRYDEPL